VITARSCTFLLYRASDHRTELHFLRYIYTPTVACLAFQRSALTYFAFFAFLFPDSDHHTELHLLRYIYTGWAVSIVVIVIVAECFGWRKAKAKEYEKTDYLTL
jgi:hypothetical protein